MKTRHITTLTAVATFTLINVNININVNAQSTPPPNVNTKFTDKRDGRMYKSVKIGKQTWMAENLNFKAEKSLCYGDGTSTAEANCNQYGRLYNWETAKTACPSGWRLPTREEWYRLVEAAGGESTAGKKLKSKSGWKDNGNGTDDFGFSALPGGSRGIGGSFDNNLGSGGYWWNSMVCGDIECSNADETLAWRRGISHNSGEVGEKTVGVSTALSVRCVAETGPAKSSSGPMRYLFEQNFAENDVSLVFDDNDYAPYSTYAPNIGFSAAKRVIYSGTIALLNEPIPETALAVLDKKELRILRNTIFAKHGMIFQSEDLQKHFKQFDWYNPKSSDVTGKLTDRDKWNIERIQVFENAKPKSNVSKKDLVNSYNEVVPAPSWCRSIAINDDNTIVYEGGAEDRYKGTYKIENGFLVVNVTEQQVGQTPEYISDKNWVWPSGVTYSMSKGADEYLGWRAVYKTPIKMVFPIGDVVMGCDDYCRGQKIGSITWWKWLNKD